MKTALGQSLIIENVGGAGGSIGVSPARRRTATPSTSASGIPMWRTGWAGSLTLRIVLRTA
jgi:tripartite-type tricarboxylate transporter receptor subunit TctC